jgi:hypothetical protein
MYYRIHQQETAKQTQRSSYNMGSRTRLYDRNLASKRCITLKNGIRSDVLPLIIIRLGLQDAIRFSAVYKKSREQTRNVLGNSECARQLGMC